MDEVSILFSVLSEFEVQGTPVDERKRTGEHGAVEVALRRGRSSQVYTVLPLMDASSGLAALEYLMEPHNRRYIFTARKMNARTAAICRSGDIDYVDLAGNVLLRFGDVYIDVQGRTSKDRLGSTEHHRASVNLFSVRRSQAIFALMAWPELFDLPLRFTSEAAGVSMGMAFQTIQLLREQGYVVGDASPQLVRRNELIDRWTDAYATGLKSRLLLGRFRGDISNVRNGDADEPLLLSGESAVPFLLRPTTLTAYMSSLDPKIILANRWRSDGQHNIEIRKKFWKDPREIIHADRGLHYEEFHAAVPPILIYADLMASDDGRQREAALSFRKEHRGLIES